MVARKAKMPSKVFLTKHEGDNSADRGEDPPRQRFTSWALNLLVGALLGFVDQHRSRGRHRDRVDGGNDCGNCNGNGELVEELPRDAADKRARHEYGA